MDTSKMNGGTKKADSNKAPRAKKELPPPPALGSPNIPTIEIPIDRIDASEDFNARRMIEIDEDGVSTLDHKRAGTKPKGKLKKTYEGVDDMAASIKERGLLSPVQVRPTKDGRFSLVFGFRRFHAVKELGWKAIPAQVAEMDDKTAYVVNAVENIVRENLTSFDTAMRCVELKKRFDITGTDIARKSNKTKGYINNLIRIVENVSPTILGRWRDGHELATTDNLNKLARLTHAEQLAKWEEWEGKESEDEESEDGEKGEKKAKAARPRATQLAEALTALDGDDVDKDDSWIEGAKAALKWALGKTKALPGVYDPAKPKKADDDEDKE